MRTNRLAWAGAALVPRRQRVPTHARTLTAFTPKWRKSCRTPSLCLPPRFLSVCLCSAPLCMLLLICSLSTCISLSFIYVSVLAVLFVAAHRRLSRCLSPTLLTPSPPPLTPYPWFQRKRQTANASSPPLAHSLFSFLPQECTDVTHLPSGLFVIAASVMTVFDEVVDFDRHPCGGRSGVSDGTTNNACYKRTSAAAGDPRLLVPPSGSPALAPAAVGVYPSNGVTFWLDVLALPTTVYRLTLYFADFAGAHPQAVSSEAG